MRLEEALAVRERLLRDLHRSGTLKVGIHGGPGTGKSTTMALVFGALKQKGLNVEMSHEYAKDLTWERRDAALQYQPYVIAKQMWRERRLEGQVDAIITDTSILYSFIYGDGSNGVTPAFRAWLLDEYRRDNHIDFFLTRDPRRPYNEAGRNQTEKEAKSLDAVIGKTLNDAGVEYESVQLDQDGNQHVDYIVRRIIQTLSLQGVFDEAGAPEYS